MNKNEFIEKMNKYGKDKIPFLFIIDFEFNTPHIYTLDLINPNEIKYNINKITNNKDFHQNQKLEYFHKTPISLNSYKQKFEKVIENINYGNSFLLNLTAKSKINTNLTLEDIYYQSNARYKLLLKDNFVVFSPEIFIQIIDGKIYSYPMKGTIDGNIENAESILLSDGKELAEHATIVDLIRNDLSKVSKDIHVEKFRYIEKIKTNTKELLQVSSKIVGTLDEDYCCNLGNIINSMLPAGSICGAPKNKTVQIILETEKYKRGFYTGVCGIFDGKNLDSFVMIRFIEKTKNGLFYKSGGGITSHSDLHKEYNELIDKIYVPIY